MKILRDISYGEDSEAQALDLYLPDGETEQVFLYFHGGGIIEGDKAIEADIFAPYLTERGIAVASANYRMYPEATYPSFISDAALALRWVYDYMSENLDTDRLFVGGSSAGGYISMMLCFDKSYLTSVGLDNSKITGYLHDAGQPTAHFTVLSNRGIDPKRVIVDETAPLYFVGLDESYPPMRFIVSDNDINGRLEQTQLMLSALSGFGYNGFDLVLMHGGHVEYCKKLEDGVSVFGRMIYDFVSKI